MRRELVAIIVAVGTFSSLALAEDAPNAKADAATPAKAVGTPKIKFDKMVYDFGTTSPVQSVSGSFTFENVGDADLKVDKPRPQCGCTVAGVKPDLLKPGDKGVLSFSVSVGGYHSGLVMKSISVPNNDPAHRIVTLTIRANIKPVVEATPGSIHLVNLHQGAMTNITINIRRTDTNALTITDIKTPAANFIHARVEPAERATNNAARLVLEIEAEGTPRMVNDSVRVFVDNGPNPILFIPVQARIVGDITLAPEVLVWPINNLSRMATPQPGTVLVKRVTVTCNKEGQVLELRNATSTLKDLSLEVEPEPLQTGKVFKVVAKLAEAPKQPERGTITIETNLANQPKLEIPVVINVYTR